jgi:flagellar biosynthesis protein FlhG
MKKTQSTAAYTVNKNMTELFIKSKKKEWGPVSTAELKHLISVGDFNKDDLVYDEDTGDWLETHELDKVHKLFQDQTEKLEKKIFAVGGGKGGVGKTLLTASLGIGLAATGKKVIIVDADLGGANLHTCMGILEPDYTFYHFYTLQRDSLADIAFDTPIENLKLISGACGTLGLANPRYSQKLRFINELKKLNADYIILDLGAGSSFNVIDFFLAAQQGLLVTTPEPMAIQETFNFVKVSLFRKLQREFRKNPPINNLIEQEAFSEPGKLKNTIPDLIKQMEKIDAEAAEKASLFINSYRPRLILNMVQSHDENREGDTLKTAIQELLGIEIDFIGSIDYDRNVRQSLKAFKPFLLDNPKSKASRSLAKLITLGIMNKSGFEGFRFKRNVSKSITEESKVYTPPKLKDDDYICSVKCFYWGDCEYQSGGHACPIRHLDPIFKK